MASLWSTRPIQALVAPIIAYHRHPSGEGKLSHFALRDLVRAEAPRAGISRIEIERFPGKVKVIVHTAKPGVLIGKKGESVKKLRTELEALIGKKIDLDIKE